MQKWMDVDTLNPVWSHPFGIGEKKDMELTCYSFLKSFAIYLIAAVAVDWALP